ncbi:DNA replication protein [Lentibacillus populi]|uniref:DNA replication protein n=1 Tax=Lentibacillus populi TaxID=1827502 RepID=A0A9W5TVA3_9BACI|nr:MULTISPECIES: DnaD domain-containing protein [Bacillaceae]MBT2214235.1 DnaD domain-containing protein [Virgibacillus dakarensis]GGB33203.1 DNA replication protein [Lentibacillus populi]
MSKSIQIQQILLNQLQIPTRLLTNYKALGLNETEVMLLLQIYRFIFDENEFPTPAELASFLTINEQECSNVLRKLMQKGFLAIEQTKNEQGIWSEVYSLDPLWEKIFSTNKPENGQEEGTIFILFEQEFGRPLSPFEIETINVWLDEDKLYPSLIKAALRESVLMGKLNFKYIDRILRDWKKKGIHTVEQAREATKSFHQKQTSKQPVPTQKRDTSFYYNWLEGDE